MATQEDFEVLVDILASHSNYSTRFEALLELAVLDEAKVTDALIAALKDTNFEVRIAAVNALGIRNDSRIIDSLQAMLKDPDWMVREAVVDVLLNFGLASVNALLTAIDEEESILVQKIGETLASFESLALKPLLDFLNSSDVNKRIGAANCLQYFSNKAILKPLLEIFKAKAEDGILRFYAAGSLTSFKEEDVLEALIEVLQDQSENADARIGAASCLSVWKDEPRVIEVFPKVLEDKIIGVRAAAISSLSSTNSVEVKKAILKAFLDDDKQLRKAAISALNAENIREFIEPITKLVHEEDDSFIFDYAVVTLAEIDDIIVVEPLIQVLLLFREMARRKRLEDIIMPILKKKTFKDIAIAYISKLSEQVNNDKKRKTLSNILTYLNEKS